MEDYGTMGGHTLPPSRPRFCWCIWNDGQDLNFEGMGTEWVSCNQGWRVGWGQSGWPRQRLTVDKGCNDRASHVWAQLGLKATAWAQLLTAQASENLRLGPSPQWWLGLAWLGPLEVINTHWNNWIYCVEKSVWSYNPDWMWNRQDICDTTYLFCLHTFEQKDWR